MTGPDVKVPTNIFYFEVLLYLSLLIDVLSAAFLDRMPDDVTCRRSWPSISSQS